jgi:hypothetical protein
MAFLSEKTIQKTPNPWSANTITAAKPTTIRAIASHDTQD